VVRIAGETALAGPLLTKAACHHRLRPPSPISAPAHNPAMTPHGRVCVNETPFRGADPTRRRLIGNVRGDGGPNLGAMSRFL